MEDDPFDVQLMSDLGMRTLKSREDWRQVENSTDELERELASKQWPGAELLGVAGAAQQDLRYWQAAFERLKVLAVPVSAPRVGRPPGKTISEPLLRAWVRYTVAKMAFDAMGNAMQAAQARGNSPNRPVCQAYFAAWRTFPILNACIMAAEWASSEQRDRAVVALSGWLSLGVKEGVSPELDATLQDAGPEFLRALCERLPGAIVAAWYELPDDQRSSRALLNRATNILRREGRLKKQQQSDGTYERAAPLRLTDAESAGDPGEVEAFVLLEEARREELRRLAPREAEIFQLHLDGHSYAEIAAITGIKVGTIGPALGRCWAKIEATGAR